jgi:hypothetical protein
MRMDDLTTYERRIVLAAMWNWRNDMANKLTEFGEVTGEDAIHEIEFVEAMDSAARKLGGDPSEKFYGAPRF